MSNLYDVSARRRHPTLVQLIKALCLDYKSRKIHIKHNDVSMRVKMEYEYLNSRIFDAAAEIVGVEFAEIFIDEIGNSTGYAKSEAAFYSEHRYKELKCSAADNIAKKLHLLD